MARDKVVLAYSGGLDTSVAVKWINETYGLDVVAYTCDLGQGQDINAIREKALRTGAVEVRFGETVQTAGPGSVVFCASNELHGLRNIGSEPATYLVIRLDSPAVASATSPAAVTASSARALLNALPQT